MAGHLCRLNFANERTESPRGKRLWVNYLESYISYLLIYAYLFSPVILPDTPVIPFTLRWAGNDSTNTCNRHKSWEPRAHQSYTSNQSTSSSPRPSSGSHLHRDAAVKFPNTAPPLQHDEESSTSNSLHWRITVISPRTHSEWTPERRSPGTMCFSVPDHQRSGEWNPYFKKAATAWPATIHSGQKRPQRYQKRYLVMQVFKGNYNIFHCGQISFKIST